MDVYDYSFGMDRKLPPLENETVRKLHDEALGQLKQILPSRHLQKVTEITHERTHSGLYCKYSPYIYSNSCLPAFLEYQQGD